MEPESATMEPEKAQTELVRTKIEARGAEGQPREPHAGQEGKDGRQDGPQWAPGVPTFRKMSKNIEKQTVF